MDWNIPPILRKLLIDVDFQTGGKTIFSGSTIVGFVGLFNGMQSGPDGWSVSLDARGKGGKLLPNIVQGLLHKSSTPTQHIRKSLETSCNYTEAVNRIGATDLIDEAYFVMAGADLWSGGVVARNRNNVADYWPLNQSEPDGWFRLETSKMMHVLCNADVWCTPDYDRTKPVPVADDRRCVPAGVDGSDLWCRRTPAVANMKAMGFGNVTTENIMHIMSTFPTYNPHTDYTVVMNPRDGVYQSGVWL